MGGYRTSEYEAQGLRRGIHRPSELPDIPKPNSLKAATTVARGLGFFGAQQV